MKRIVTLIATLFLGAAFGLEAMAESTLQKITTNGVLVAGVPDDEPPFAFRDRYSGQVIGYDVDFVTAIANRLGVRARFKAVTEGDRLSELLDGDIDIIAAGLTHSDARNAVIDFSEAYLVSGQKLIAKAGSIKEQSDLIGKRIGTVVGTFAEACVRGTCLASIIVPYDDYVDGIKALQKGEIDAFTADEAILVDLFAGLQGRGFEIPDVFILEEEYYLGMRKGDKDFLARVNRTIRSIQQEGEAERIRTKWLTPQEELPPPAYGSVVRKASTRPRFLGVVLNGILYPDSEVSMFALNGERVGKGWISAVVGDEFYVDVEEEIYDFIRPGFLVAMNMNSEMAMDVLLRRRNVLETVKEESLEEAAEVQAQIRAEAEEKHERSVEMDIFRQKLEETSAAARRARDDRYRYYRGRRYYYGRFRR